jgi:adenylylsulfate kinase
MPDNQALAILLTGLPSSGKSTLGRALKARLDEVTRCHLLDGDELRERLPPQLGFSVEDRRHQGKRALYVASLLLEWDVTAVIAVIAPLEETRQAFRQAFAGRYFEVYLHASADVRSARDTRGVYARAIAAGDTRFETIDDVYEPPTNPDLTIDTAATSIHAALAEILAAINADRR